MNWYDKLKEVHSRCDTLRAEATDLGAKLGHKLGHKLEGWTTLQSCYCRKCGMFAKINGVYGKDDGPTFYGSAFINPCKVNFNNGDSYKWQKYENPWPLNAMT